MSSLSHRTRSSVSYSSLRDSGRMSRPPYMSRVCVRSSPKNNANLELFRSSELSKYSEAALLQAVGDLPGQGFRISMVVADRFDRPLFEAGVKVL